MYLFKKPDPKLFIQDISY